MNAYSFLESKLNNFVNYLSDLPIVQKNSTALSKLPSFRDVKWSIEFSKQISNQFDRSKEDTCRNLIIECGLVPKEFSTEEFSKIIRFVECFVETCRNI